MTTDMYKALKSAGVEDELATAAARGLPDNPVTQAHVVELRAELKADMAELRAELKADVAEIRTDVERIEKRMTWRMVVICGIFSSIQTSVTVALIQALA